MQGSRAVSKSANTAAALKIVCESQLLLNLLNDWHYLETVWDVFVLVKMSSPMVQPFHTNRQCK